MFLSLNKRKKVVNKGQTAKMQLALSGLRQSVLQSAHDILLVNKQINILALCMIALQGTCRRDLLSQGMVHSAMDSYAASHSVTLCRG